MLRRLRLLRLVTGAFVAFAGVASAASAATMHLSPAGSIAEVSQGAVTFEFAELVTVECNITFEGTMRESFAMSAGAEVGSLTEGTVESCENGIVELLWPGPIIYGFTLGETFAPTGFLANIEYFEFLVSTALFRCLYTVRGGMLFGISENQIIGATLLREPWLIESIYLGGLLGCPRQIVIAGTFGVTPAQTVSVT